jgi:uncharacterized protein (DUF697 family)
MTMRAAAEDTAPAEGTAEVSPREKEALAIARRYRAWSAAAGLLPLPGFDVAAILAVQLKMLADLAKVYELPFRRDIAKEVISSLLGSVLTVTVAQASSSAIKGVPVIGQIAGMVVQPALAVAVTWAIAKVFIQHFESGGTFLDFHPETVKAYFLEQFEAAKRGVSGSTGT